MRSSCAVSLNPFSQEESRQRDYLDSAFSAVSTILPTRASGVSVLVCSQAWLKARLLVEYVQAIVSYVFLPTNLTKTLFCVL